MESPSGPLFGGAAAQYGASTSQESGNVLYRRVKEREGWDGFNIPVDRIDRCARAVDRCVFGRRHGGELPVRRGPALRAGGGQSDGCVPGDSNPVRSRPSGRSAGSHLCLHRSIEAAN